MKKTVCLIMAVLLLSGIMVGCGSADEGEAVAVQSVAMVAGIQNSGLYNSYAGLVVSKGEVTYSKDDTRTISEILVEEGDVVSEGDVLFTYDDAELQLNIEKGELELEQMENSVTTYKNQIATLEKEKKAAPESEKLDYTMQIQALEIDKKELEYNITVKEKELERLKNSAGTNEVVCTINGTVKAVNENGGYDEMGNPLPFISVAETGEYKVKGTINELNVYDLPEGTPVIIRSRADASVIWTGYVESIDWENQVSSDYSYMYYPEDEMTSSTKYPFYVALDDAANLMLGQHVYIEPNIGQQEQQSGLNLPEYYIVDAESAAPWVWVANEDDELEKRELVLGDYDVNTGTYVVVGGLTEDDYIAYPDESLEKGNPVVYYDDEFFAGDMGSVEMGTDDMIYDEGGVVEGEVYEDDYAVYEEGIAEGEAVSDEIYAEDGSIIAVEPEVDDSGVGDLSGAIADITWG